jgi:RNA polymerase sigma factor (sigma-70 family)|tara:strand:+ start:1508 stop:2041 length:534 start_codon:yes stop_codon:yes gene_type:complete
MSCVTPEREKMGEQLMEIKPLLMSIAMHKFGLSPANADDLFQDTCVYMLDRGVIIFDANKSYLPAIRWVHHRRCINHLRDSKRWDHDLYETLRERDHLSSSDRVENIDAQLDAQAIQEHLLKHKDRGTNKYSGIIAKHFFDEELNVQQLSRDYGLNRHTMHAAKRRMRIVARGIYEG